MPMHAERDIVLPVLSVCPSVQCRYRAKTNGHFLTLWYMDIILDFLTRKKFHLETHQQGR